MDLATLIGLGSGTAVVLLAIFMGGDFMTFVNVPSLLLVVGGAAAATVLRFTLTDVVIALRTGISAALAQVKTTPRLLIDEIAELARKARKEGLIGLDGSAQSPDQHHPPARGTAAGDPGRRWVMAVGRALR